MSVRDWGDACQVLTALMIPGDVWRTFLAQESTRDAHPGAVLRWWRSRQRMIADREPAPTI